MPANLRWYPNELPALTQSTSSSSALETAVRSLQNDARTQSIRQALSRRSAGIIAAAEQNRGAIVIGSLMPLVIDPVVRSQPAAQTVSAVGTVGYVFGMGGGNIADVSADRVTFATDVVTALAGRTNFGRKHRAGASRLISGILAGGTTDSGNAAAGEVEEFVFTTEAIVLLPSFLPFAPTSNGATFQPHGQRAPSGFSSTSQGFFAGFASSPSGNEIARISFDSKTAAVLPVLLTPAFHSGVAGSTPSAGYIFANSWLNPGVHVFRFETESSRFNAVSSLTVNSRQLLTNGVSMFVFGGNMQNPTWSYRYSPQLGLFTRIVDLPSAVSNAARVGSSSVGYLCGGTSGGYQFWNSFYTNAGLQSVAKFSYQTESIAAAPNTLSTPRSHGVGISNFAGAFV